MTEQISQQQLDNIVITNQNEALNVLAQFLHLAQRRGAFTLPESSKIYESLKFFQVPESSNEPPAIVPDNTQSMMNNMETL